MSLGKASQVMALPMKDRESVSEIMKELAEESLTGSLLFEVDGEKRAQRELQQAYAEALQALWEAPQITQELWAEVERTMNQHYKHYAPKCGYKGGRSINVEFHEDPIVVPLQDSVEEVPILMHCVLSTRGLLNGALPGNYGENGILGEVDPESMIPDFFSRDFKYGQKLIGVRNACHAARKVEPKVQDDWMRKFWKSRGPTFCVTLPAFKCDILWYFGVQ